LIDADRTCLKTSSAASRFC